MRKVKSGILGLGSIPFIGCVALLAAMVLQVLSFAAPFWASASGRDFGLWRKHRCEETDLNPLHEGCRRWNHPWDVAEWEDAVRAMECLTIIFWAIPLVVLPVYIYVALGLYYRCLLGTMTVMTLLGFLTCFVGYVIYGIKLGENDWTVGWCYILNVIGSALGLIAFFIFLIATCFRPKFEPEQHYISGFYVSPDKNQLYVVENVEPPGKAESTISGGHVNHVMMVED